MGPHGPQNWGGGKNGLGDFTIENVKGGARQKIPGGPGGPGGLGGPMGPHGPQIYIILNKIVIYIIISF